MLMRRAGWSNLLGVSSPPLAERWARSLRQECLNHLVIFGLSRLQHVLDEYVTFFNGEHQPHQGIGYGIPEQFKDVGSDEERGTDDMWPHLGIVQCQQFTEIMPSRSGLIFR
jgi:hypothetical protein